MRQNPAMNQKKEGYIDRLPSRRRGTGWASTFGWGSTHGTLVACFGRISMNLWD